MNVDQARKLVSNLISKMQENELAALNRTDRPHGPESLAEAEWQIVRALSTERHEGFRDGISRMNAEAIKINKGVAS